MARELTGRVVSDKADKTIVIAVVTRKTHPLYKKQYTATKRFKAHDEKNVAKIGDKVIITESRPISAQKHFTLVKVVDHGGVVVGNHDEAVVQPTEESKS